ncbi:MAG TPA: sodium/glutamate symporter, partial [Methylomirabilota bacterium]|nr:sodium/glutamate symporter [Methylomirabilota bacterium]
MTIPAWFAVAFAIPVLLLGEVIVRRIRLLARFNIPAPVVGGLLVALLVLAGNLGGFAAKFETSVTAQWWTWLVTIEPDWLKSPSRNVNQPFLVAFFTCIGLNASWSLVRKGSWPMLLFLLLSAFLAVAQNLVGVPLARLLGESPLLGLVCGSLTLTGGVGTALGFAPELEKAGLPNAAVVSVAAATFGLVAGGLIGGPLGGWLIRKHNLKSDVPSNVHLEPGLTAESGILRDLAALGRYGRRFLMHLLMLLICIKGGAWVSHYIQQTNFTFPVYMGALLLGVVVRNAVDVWGGRIISTEIVDTLASVVLGLFLAIAMMSLNLVDLANTALPMLIILAVQVILMGLFAWLVTFPLLGRTYDAAIMSAGQVGFSLGATPNAVANMKALVEK